MATYKQLSEMNDDDLNWNNEYHIREIVRRDVKMLKDVLLNEYEWEDEDDVNENIWEVVDGLENVIYNYNAEKVARAFDKCPFDKSEITGDNYNSWNEMAYEVYYDEVSTKIYNHFNNK